jgi:hypothetical protein
MKKHLIRLLITYAKACTRTCGIMTILQREGAPPIDSCWLLALYTVPIPSLLGAP